MSAASKEYVSKIGIGAYEACIRLRSEILERIRELNRDRQRATLFLRVMMSAEDVADEMFTDDMVDRVIGAASGCYPFLWLNLTYNPASVTTEALAQFENDYQLVTTGDAFSQDTPWNE